MKLMTIKGTKIIIYLFTFGFIFGLLFYNFTGYNKIKSATTKTNKNDIPDSNYFFETFNGDDLKIGEIGLFSSCDEVFNHIGKPQTKHQVKESAINNSDYIAYTDTWVYPGIEIRFLTSVKKGKPAPSKPDRVSGIVVTGSKYATKRGIKVGDPSIKVLKKYGYRDAKSNLYTYGVDLLYIEFVISKGKVSRIEIGGYPD